VALTLTYAPEGVTLRVLDDGPDDERERPTPGVGLALMAERIRELGGVLAVERSASGFGLTLEVPT
jgi:signal transduction histidine kinase